jgi:hypothetical protein
VACGGEDSRGGVRADKVNVDGGVQVQVHVHVKVKVKVKVNVDVDALSNLGLWAVRAR